MTSSTAMGWARVLTQRGVSMTGRRSTRPRTSSKDRLPEPMITDARNSTVATPLSLRILPTSRRLARCGERSSPWARPPM